MDLVFAELVATAQNPLCLEQYQLADKNSFAVLSLTANESTSALKLLLVVPNQKADQDIRVERPLPARSGRWRDRLEYSETVVHQDSSRDGLGSN